MNQFVFWPFKKNITLALNRYYAVGRLVSNTRNGVEALKTEYAYNVRSWMKGITGTLFSQSLYYNNKRSSNTNEVRYNGNIAGMDWIADSKNRGYDFSYDALSQLTGANYLEGGARSDKFDTSYSYDRQGNVLTLSRRGNAGTTTYNTVDNLTMNYVGNQRIRVEDTATNPSLSMSMDFKNGTSQEIEYSDASNGNMVKDLNKEISSIEYNVLNLPQKVTFTGANNPVNEYVYSEAGKKLAVIHKSSTDKRTDYAGNMIYENSSLKRILVDGGYIENGIYHFFLQDHLGNNRIVAKADGAVVQTNHYYPYGMSFAESTQTSNQPYRYNGKEIDWENGMNLYDYEAKQMEVATGRFTTIDPLAEKYYSVSPYVYCANNPIRNIDPTGMDWYQTNNGTIHWTDYTSQKYLDENDIKGKYLGQSHVVFEGSRNEKLGTKKGKGGYIDGDGAITASVTVYGFNGEDDITLLTGFTMTSDVKKHGAISEGLFNANYDSKGKSGALKSNWVLNNRGEIPTMDNEPNLSPYAGPNSGKPVKTGIFIHSTNNTGYAGGTVSTGCLLLTPQDFRTFNTIMSGVSNFTVRVTREQIVKEPLQGVTGIVPNVFIQKLIIRR